MDVTPPSRSPSDKPVEEHGVAPTCAAESSPDPKGIAGPLAELVELNSDRRTASDVPKASAIDRIEPSRLPHPLQGFWLVRKTLSGEQFDPFKSIMELDNIDTARAIVALTKKRFPGDYVAERRQIESWLANEAERLNIKPDGLPPIYFGLAKAPPTQAARDGYDRIVIAAESISTAYLTFTVYDSFHNFAVLTDTITDTTPAGLEPRVFSAATLREHIEAGRIPSEVLEVGGPDYVECQVWSREALRRAPQRRFDHPR